MANKYILTSKDREVDLLARTAWGEARGDGRWGMQAVINVVMNRVNAGKWWGRTVEEVVLKPWQFSCWNENDPNRRQVLDITEDDAQFKQAVALAKLALNDNLPDTTDGATHYYAAYTKEPAWASSGQQTVQIGNHIFYKGVA